MYWIVVHPNFNQIICTFFMVIQLTNCSKYCMPQKLRIHYNTILYACVHNVIYTEIFSNLPFVNSWIICVWNLNGSSLLGKGTHTKIHYKCHFVSICNVFLHLKWPRVINLSDVHSFSRHQSFLSTFPLIIILRMG